MAGFLHRCPVSSPDSACTAVLSEPRFCSYSYMAWHVCGGQSGVRKPRETSVNVVELDNSKEQNGL